ncbi:unnamed protein product [Adineta steineri]|uniref:Peptidase S1 domain-containing protein n=1 Tax=Adineta steineri TaxID=433720 RepID=A0A813WLA3_9BILA|nr:unnamed protein product [Adineta steineri]CAF0856593.1 unnamed protein product [Adineta steineri]CAF0948388.1 unnamed protein product [Adineta steineri]
MNIKLLIFILSILNKLCIGARYECNYNEVSCGCGISNVELNPLRIIGGEEAISYSWPMIVSLRNNRQLEKKHYCSGSIINKYFILTAAQCVINMGSPSNILTATAIHNRTDIDAIEHSVKNIFIHPNYTGHKDGFKNDIALLELDIPLDIDENSFHAKTCLSEINISINVTNYPSNGARLIVIGYGSKENDHNNLSNNLQQTELFTIDNNDSICRRSFIDPEKQICTGIYQGGKGTCRGGPVLQWIGNRWEQIGIVSYTRCGIFEYPSIYTRLAYYNDWINSIINKHNVSLNITVVQKPQMTYDCNKSKVPCGCGYKNVNICQSRIIGGEGAVQHSWSIIVSLRMDCSGNNKGVTHCCGGTILTESYILTAAHCVDNSLISNITVVAGIHNRVQINQTIRTVDRIIAHPNYTGPFHGLRNDIALLHLSEPLDFDTSPFIARTCLPHRINSSANLLEYPSNGTNLIVIDIIE